MIIVSQDKKQIINLANVTRIFIEKLDEDDEIKKYGIGADTNSAESMVWELGYYESEERAKEVLRQIYLAYGNMSMLMIPHVEIHEIISANRMFNAICYEMPER